MEADELTRLKLVARAQAWNAASGSKVDTSEDVPSIIPATIEERLAEAEQIYLWLIKDL